MANFIRDLAYKRDLSFYESTPKAMKQIRSPFTLRRDERPSNRFARLAEDAGIHLLDRALGLYGLDQMYRRVIAKAPSRSTRLNSTDFVELALKELNIGISVETRSLERIPKAGGVVIVANHPFGGIEAVVLMKLLQEIRPDAKFMANFMLERIQELDDCFIYVDPFGSAKSTSRNTQPLRECVDWLRKGGLLCVFPSGTVSHLHPRRREVTDRDWSPTVSRVIRMGRATVVPVFFHGRNSNLFQAAGMLHPLLRTALIPNELYNKRGKTISLNVGNSIPQGKLQGFNSDEEMIDYLRLRTYILGNKDPHSNAIATPLPVAPRRTSKKGLEPLIAPISTELLKRDIATLSTSQILLESGEMQVFFARSRQIPNVLQEIGRLREKTFRAVHEGTGRSIDLDRFDRYYTHLFIWNRGTAEVVGAYRLGRTDRILKRFGKNGLYTSTLFAYRASLLEQIGPALEVGRSFVRCEYQKSYTPLLLLWKGIGHFVVRNPRCKVLFGPVSINNQYDSLSRQLIATFLRANNYLPELAKLIRARNPMRPLPLMGMDLKTTSRVVKDLSDVSELLQEIESTQKSIPILLKQYLKLGAKLIGFNVDPSFGDVLDGLIFVDMSETDYKLLERYLGKEGAPEFLRFHGKEVPPTHRERAANSRS